MSVKDMRRKRRDERNGFFDAREKDVIDETDLFKSR